MKLDRADIEPDWRAGYWGPDWTATRQRYWDSRWCRRRCFWCRRGQPGRWWSSRRRLHLNHLTYLYRSGTGRTPLWTLRPMCPTCHSVETWLTRRVVRPWLYRHPMLRPWEHAVVTYAGRWTINVTVLATGWWAWMLI